MWKMYLTQWSDSYFALVLHILEQVKINPLKQTNRLVSKYLKKVPVSYKKYLLVNLLSPLE